MAITLPDTAQSAGVPTQWDDTISATAQSILSGNVPELLITDEIVAFSQTIAALTVVGKNAAGEIVPAVYDGTTPANNVKAIGIAVIAITTAASGAKKGLKVYRGGCFNPDKLVWPASFTSDAIKFAAFEGSPAPTSIVMRRPAHYTI